MSAGLCSSRTSPSVSVQPVDHRRRGGDQIEVELALQPLLNHLQVQQAEEAAAEARTQRRRAFRLVVEAGIVQPQLGERLAQVLELGGVGREQAAEHHRHRRLEAGQRLRRRPSVLGDRIADVGVGDRLDAGGDEADLARPQRLGLQWLRA